ncbi:MAG TPA: NUDIX hydrolase [Saprospiraceae bacterium]|nr:NUDIX hydrolase [Saprospiraceae bacterium]HMQ84586.1 NUDIX hydrolase [Saprospiraceae bacterium]
MTDWIKKSSAKGPDLKLFKARYDLMVNPRNGKSEQMIILESNDSVNVVALTPDRHVLFVRQYRFGIADYTLELPGGIVDAQEVVAHAAQRELREETGYSSNRWTELGKIPSNPVFMNSYIHHWLAMDVMLTHEPELDDGEAVETVLIPLETVRQQYQSGFFQHPHTVNALLLFFHHLDKFND